jgi:hypothetical protein
VPYAAQSSDQQTRLREDREVGGVAGLREAADLRLELLRRLVLDVDVVLFLPVRPGLFEKLGLGIGDRAVDRDDAIGLADVARTVTSAALSSRAAAEYESTRPDGCDAGDEPAVHP